MRRARTYLLQTLVERDVYAFVRAESARRGLSVSSYLRQLLQEQMELPPEARLAAIEAQIESLRQSLVRSKA